MPSAGKLNVRSQVTKEFCFGLVEACVFCLVRAFSK